LLLPHIEECVGSHEKCACSPPNQVCESGIDFAWTARFEGLNLNPESASRSLQFLQLLSCLRIVWIYDDGDKRDVWHQLMKQLQSLCFHGDGEQANSRCIAAWAIEGRHRTGLHWIVPHDEDDRDRRSRGLRRRYGRASSDQNDYSYAPIHQLKRLLRKSIVLSLRPTILDCDVATLDVAGFSQPLFDCFDKAAYGAGETLPRMPMTGIAGCCARAASGHAAAPAMSAMISRRLMSRMALRSLPWRP
jgi:hypothetical protein